MKTINQIQHALVNIHQRKPLVITVANFVTANKVADCISAIGASPFMPNSDEEATDLARLATAIVINLGTINNNQMKLAQALLKNRQAKIPIILDPVAVGTSIYRRQCADQLLATSQINVIRANTAEVAALMHQQWEAQGIDSGAGTIDRMQLAQQCAQYYHCLVVMTGQTDVITDGQQVLVNHINSPALAVNVGSGDILSSLLGAFLASSLPSLKACYLATKYISLVGHWAETTALGIGDWQVNFLNALSDENLWKEEIKND